MRGGDRLHDREAETVAVIRADAGVAEPLERLKEALDVGGGDDGSGVADPESGAVGRGAGRDLDRAAGGVVADRVVEQVRHEALHEAGVAGRVSLIEGGVNLDAAAVSVKLPAVDNLLAEFSEVERLPALDAAFADRERQQGIDQPLLLARQL